MALLYRTIANRLLEELQAGSWRDGALIPSEAELQESYRISRSTVRRALALLEKDGHVERRQGLGSFYRSHKIGKRISSRVDFHSEGRTHGQQPSTRALSFTARVPSLSEMAVFGPEARNGVVELRRLRLLNGHSTVFQTSVLCHVGMQDMKRSDFEDNSLYELLRSRFGVIVSTVSETLEAINASPEISRIIGIEPGVAIFNTHRIVQDQNERVVELSNNYVRADRYYFSFTGSVEEFGR
ncbi:GntR family transcriptional regulator [Mesorhizobium sp.]|uniref:GntR family transcriptional regulator n=1 Tax=Mesorhizobium sp. TaxID=1871066 RepID=UPI00257FA215|nr:GntR family transcriptional regulator [Mesorhizobium sp.]